MCVVLDKAFVFPHCIFERHILIALSHTVRKEAETAVRSDSDQQHEVGVLLETKEKKKKSFDLSPPHLHI